jgi:hypothetical protein
MGMWRRQLELGLGLEGLEGKRQLVGLVDSDCAQSAEGSVILPVDLMQQHHCTAALVLMLWRQTVLPETGCWGQVVSEEQQVMVCPTRCPPHLNQMCYCLHEWWAVLQKG